MPGTNARTGQPLHFRCWRCRRSRRRVGGTFDRVSFTGRVRRYRGGAGCRTALMAVQYQCDCGHVGWSRHKDLVRRAAREGILPEATE